MTTEPTEPIESEQDAVEPDQEEPDDAPANPVPVKIHLTSGKCFVVDTVGGWQYQEQGIFANGHFKERTTEADVLIPYKSVEYLEFDFKALARYLKKQQELRDSVS